MLLPLALALLAIQQAPAIQPTLLFREACLGGSLKISREAIKPVDYHAMPGGARLALARSLAKDTPEAPREFSPKDVINPIYSLDGGRIFLMTSTAAPVAGSRLGEVCAVIWAGNDFKDAEKELFPAASGDIDSTPPGESLERYSYSAVVKGSVYLVAVGNREWTALSSAPVSLFPYPKVIKSNQGNDNK